MSWTLTYDGQEKTFEEWGILENLPFEFCSQREDSIQVLTSNDFDDAFTFEYDAKVVIRRDRVLDDGGALSGGSIFFQGYVGKPRRDARGEAQNHRYTFYGPWWLIERCQFQQARKIFTGYERDGWGNYVVPLVPSYQTVLTSDFVLGEDINELAIHTGQVLRELLAYANECWNPTKRGAVGGGRDDAQDIFQIGTIGVAVPIPRQAMRDRKVGELVREMLRWSQDAIAYFDYSTVPPTLNIVRAGDMPAVNLNVTQDQFEQLGLEPRYDRRLSGVIIRYKKTKTQDGNVWQDKADDIYPPGVSEYAPDASVHTIELVGSTLSTVQGRLETAPLQANYGASDTDATRLAWWKAHDTTLADATISGLHVSGVTVVDEAGVAVDLGAFPNELLAKGGQVADWMTLNGSQVQAKTVTVQGKVSYTKKGSALDATFEQVTLKPVHVRITLTNGTTGNYQAISHYDPGEGAPVGLAQAIYEGLATLQFEGSPTILGTDLDGRIQLGKTLTITTPGNVFAGLLIQVVSGDLTSGSVTPTLGPPNQLGLTDMIELLRVNRYRLTWNLPSGRSTGAVAGSAGGVNLGQQQAKENTVAGAQEKSLTTISSPIEGVGTAVIQHDADQQTHFLGVLDNDGAPLASPNAYGNVLLRLGRNGAAPFDGADGEELRIQRVHYTDTSGQDMRVRMLVSQAQDDGPEADHLDDSEYDIYIGGGGGGGGQAKPFKLSSVQDDYLTCYALRQVATATVTTAGTNYQVGDILTPAGGTGSPTARLKVTAITGGGSSGPISTVSILSGGDYSADPTLASNVPTGGHGSGAHFTLTMSGGAGSGNIYVAKQPRMRSSISSETKCGVQHDYSYMGGDDSLNKLRVDALHSNLSDTEMQRTAPVWLPNETIFAVPADTLLIDPNGSPITWMVLGTRLWEGFASGS